MTNKKKWQCITPGCGRARYQGEWCDACTRRFTTPLPVKKVIGATVSPTGATRRLDGRDEREMTDGKMRWWVGATEEAA